MIESRFGIDYRLYMDAAERWLTTGQYFEPHQLVGPYRITHGDVLYPPVALWLFVPFTRLPAALWWILPLGSIAWVTWRLRPSFVVWPLVVACIGWQPVQVHILAGNPVMWPAAAAALGVLASWPAVFVLLKPSLALFALIGVTRRSWWAALGVFGLMCLPFGTMWIDWIVAITNSTGGGLLYSWQETPLFMIPILAWLARPGGRYGRIR